MYAKHQRETGDPIRARFNLLANARHKASLLLKARTPFFPQDAFVLT
jgi:hypothetical protein